jgi:hypothetical protein
VATLEAGTFPDPAAYPEQSAEQTLARWLSAWRDQDWEGMAFCSQTAWRFFSAGGSTILRSWFSLRRVQAAQFDAVHAHAGVLPALGPVTGKRIDCTLLLEVGQARRTRTVRVIVVREDGGSTFADAAPARWGVYPNSASPPA